MKRFSILLATEAKLFLRNPTSVFMGFLFPSLLLLLQGFLIPGTRNLIDLPVSFGPSRVIDLLVPVSLSVAMGSVALSTFPAAVGAYREHGVLRRLATTPLHPARVLAAQLLVNGAALFIAASLAVITGAFALHVRFPVHLGVVALAFTLGAVQMLSLGALIAARASTAQSANGMGTLLYFACLFTAGLWTPGAMMSDTMREITSFLPLGAASQALTAGWYGEAYPVRQLLVMVLWTALFWPLSSKWFRWVS